MALPFTDAYNNGIVEVGDQSWTAFINTENFKGPIAFYLPETWAKLSERYPLIEGRGLDARPGIINGGAMEINTVPHFEATSSDGTQYIKVPKLNFPVNQDRKAPLVQDLKYYNRLTLYNEILNWRENDVPSQGSFISGMISPTLTYNPPFIDITSHAAEVIYDETPAGIQRKTKRKRPGTLGICALIQKKYNLLSH